MRFLLLLAGSHLVFAATAEIAIEVGPDRQVSVREHFSALKTEEFVYLASSCGRVANLHIGGLPEPAPAGVGPWMMIVVPQGSDLSFKLVPNALTPRTCAVPLIMPKVVLDSVSLSVDDNRSGLAGVALPHMTVSSDGKRWTATLPAAPSKVELEWATGIPAAPDRRHETGLFFWNFYSLVAVLVTWTIAYLLWARRAA